MIPMDPLEYWKSQRARAPVDDRFAERVLAQIRAVAPGAPPRAWRGASFWLRDGGRIAAVILLGVVVSFLHLCVVLGLILGLANQGY
jgi:hypothetical protein